MTPPRRCALLIAALSALILAACSEVESPRAPLKVYAASSLTEALSALEAPFEAQHPDLDLRLSFAGSQTLALQIEQGAPADIFIAAKREHVEPLVNQRLASPPELLAHNRLALIVPAHNPAGLKTLADLPHASKVVLGIEASPIGLYTEALIAQADKASGGTFRRALDSKIVSRELNVRLVRAKVLLGEADAAIVYATDALGAPGLSTVPLTDAQALKTDYVAVSLRPRERADAKGAFRTFLRQGQARELFAALGYLAP